VVMLLICSRGQ